MLAFLWSDLREGNLGSYPRKYTRVDLYKWSHIRRRVHWATNVGVYRQAWSGIPLAVGFVGRNRLLWNSMVQGIPYILCGCLYCLRCWWRFEGAYPPLYIQGNRVTWKVLAEYSWSPTTTQSSRFLCTTTSSTHIRIVTKEVRYIHELPLTLEHSMSISRPAVPGLTSPRALHSRVL